MVQILRLKYPHSWQVSPKEAVAIQEQLRGEVIRHDDVPPVRCVAGVDCGLEQGGSIVRAAVAVLRIPDLRPLDQAVARLPAAFPYIPGLLSFREIPTILRALEELKCLPDLLLVDGQGLAHPRRFGLASHLGVLTEIPSIGVGKTRLIGSYEEPPDRRGASTPLYHKQEIIGAVLRTRERVKPLFISLGHRVSLETSLEWVMRCTTRYRLPETTRAAHRLASI